ncbi:MAG: magnesium transporter, partial [Actinomycetota bacterium]|nr:magnesium transporter [Actinomycetota bacterium]
MELSAEPGRIRALVASRDLTELALLVRSLPPRGVVEALRALPVRDAAITFRLLGKDESIEVFEALGSDDQTELVRSLGHTEITEVFTALDPEEQAWLLDEVPAKVAKRLVAAVSPDGLETVMSLLGYPHGSVGRRMSPQVLRSEPDEDVEHLLARVRAAQADAEMLVRIPVLGADRELLGTVDPIDLLRHATGTRVHEVMDHRPT